MRRVTIRARGHRNVRAVHPKTIELTADADLSPRGTCIVGVSADLDPGRLSGLTGRVVVTLEAAGVHDVVHAVANPRYDASTGRLVVRRSHHRGADTVAFDADKGSADLDRALLDALVDDTTEVRVTIEPDRGREDDEGDDDATLVLDADLAAAQAIAQRVCVLTGGAGPVTFAGRLPRAATERRRVLAEPSPSLTVWEVRTQDIGGVAADLGDRLVAVVTDPATPDERVHRIAPAGSVRAKVAFVVATSPGSSSDDRLLAALVDAGVPARTLQDALAAAAGIGRRDAYDRVLRSRR